MKTRTLAALAAAATLASGAFAQDEHPVGHGLADVTPHAAGQAGSVSMQGDEEPMVQALWSNPHIGRAYQASVMTLADGAESVDRAAFQELMDGIHYDLAVSIGIDPELFVDHVKLIPGQIIDIAAEDPTFLDSFESYKAAVHGPE
ncbi:MAG: hypothetical protein PVI23_07210 [Maricaulaceae bacterium]